ncbi:hypothetical protein AY599_08410 [Leptolyngbya valderiana BDU 20041]|nr:hypothetical protein AY599_08410 [Leptolyngbya valderiana BDU 20041]
MAMKTSKASLILAALLLVGCAGSSQSTRMMGPESDWMTPRDAIFQAAEAAPGFIEGTFVLRVLASGSGNGQTYLNSELDYRDQRCLTISISPAASRALTERLGAPPGQALINEDILVRGPAQRVRIDFMADGRPSGSYYYQTHVFVTDAAQIVVL